MKYKRTQKRSKQMWQRVEKFSIRKFSFGAASCLIGASLVGVAINPNIVDAAFKQLNGEDGIVSLYSNSGETPESADGIEIRSKVNVDKEIGIDVDWSEYTRENPFVKVTYTYNGGADGERVAGYGGHRARFWFTTPIGLKEPKEITLKKNDGNPVYVMKTWEGSQKFTSLSNSVNSRFQTKDDINRAYRDLDFRGDDTKWESYNDTTGENHREYSGSFANKFWYHIGERISDDPYEQAIYERFRTNTKTMYVDWERAGIDRATITAVYEVADPTLGNNRSTLEFGAGFRVGIARMMQHYKTVLAPVPTLYKLNEIFEPSVPTRVAVKDTNKLTEEEKKNVRERLWEANKETVTSVARTGKNKLIENLKNEDKTESILIGNDGKATIIYSDNTEDVIPGTSLVYKVTETNTHKVGNGYEYDIKPIAVKDINSITEEEKKRAIKSFLEANGLGVSRLKGHSTKEDIDYSEGTKEEHTGITWFAYDESSVNGKNIGTHIGTKENSSTVMLSNQAGYSGVYAIPTSELYYKEGASALDLAKKDAEAAIDNLTYLSSKEKQNFKTELASKNSQDDLNTVVNNAITQNSSNEKALETKKRDAKEAINNNPYLTNAQKKELTDKVSAVVMTDPTEGNATPIEHTKGLIDKILDEALEKTKEKAKAIIDEIDNKDGKAGYLTDPTADAYKERIKNAPSQAEITKIIGEAQAQVSKKAHDTEKAKADALKEEYKKKIDQIPGLTDDDRNLYKKEIDHATTRDQLEDIVKDAEVKAYRDTAKAKIDALEHLNAAQKAELKTQVDAAGSKAEVDNIVSIAQGLDSKMDSLQKLVAEAEKVKASDKYTNPSVPQDKKTAFDNAKDAASKVADKTTDKPENAAGTSEVATLIDNLAKAIKELTGQDVAVPVSKDALKAELDLNTDDAVKKSPAYAKEADVAKKKAYDDALANAQKVYDKQDATQTDVDNALETLKQARLALSGKAEDFTLAVKDGAAKISVVPKVGESLTEQADKDAVKAKVTANGNDLDDTYSVEYGAIAEKGDKKVVPVTVTHDGITRTVDVPVEGTDAAKSPLNDPEKVKVNNVANLSEDEKAAVKAAVKKANTNLTDNQISVDNTGKVTVTYSDKSQNELPASKTVEAKTEAEKALDKAKEKAKADLTEAANKEKAEIEADKNLTDQQKADKKAEVDKVKKEQEANIDKAQTTDEVAKATEDGKKAIDAVHKTELDKAKEKAKADLTEAANKEKAEIEADKGLTDQQKADKKAEVDKVKKAQEENIDKTGTTDEVAKATEDGKKAIDAVHQTDADKSTPTVTAGEVPVSVDPATDKKVAEADKKAITEAVVVPEGQPQPTDKQVKDDGKIVNGTGANEGKKVVVVEVTYGDGSKDEIEVPVRKATDQEKAKADLTKAADAEKAEIDEDNALSKKEKEALKKQVDKLKAKHEENINNATSPEAIASATEKGRQEIAAVHTPQDITETAKRKLTPPKERVKVTDINHLTDEEKEAVKKAIVATNPSLEESEVYVSDKGDVVSPKGYLEAEKVVVQALNKPATPVVVADPNHLTNDEKEKVKEAVANANPGLSKDDITVDDKGNVTTKNGDKLLAKDVVTPALKKPATPVVVGNPNDLTTKEKEDIKDAVVAANPGLNKGDVTVDNQGNVKTPKGNLPKEDVVTTVLNKPNKLVEVENPNSLTVKEKEAVKKAIVEANPGLTEDKVKVDDQGNVTTPQGNLPAKDVVTSTLKKPTTPVEVVNPSKLTEPEKSKIVEEIIKNNPGLTDKDIKVDDQGNVETPKGNLPAEDVVTPALKKPTKLVPVKDVHSLTEAEKDAVKDAIVAANPGLNKDDVKVDGQGNVETPQGNLPAKDVVTSALKKPVTPVGVKDSNNLTDKEKEDVKKAIVEANPGLNKDDVKVDDQGNVETPNGNLPKEDVVVQTAKGQSTSIFKPELDLQTALVSGKVTVEKGKDLTDEEILKQLALADGLTAKITFKPTTTESGTKEAEVEVTLADGTKVTVKVPVEVVDSLGTADKDNDLAKAKEDAKKQVEDAAKKKLDEIKKDTDLTEEQKQKAEETIKKAKEDANKAIDEASSAGTAKQIADQAKENIEKYDPKADAEVKKPDVTNLDEEKAKAKAEILEEAQKRINEIKNNKDLSDEAKQKAIEEINKAKDKAIEDINKGQSKDEINAAKEAGIHKINEVQPEGSIASKFEPKVPENKVEVENPAKLSDEEREQVRQNIEGANTFPDGTTVEVKPDGTAVITYKDGSSDTISKDKLVTPANKEAGTIASRTEPVIPGKTQVGNTTKLTPEEQATVKKAVEEANNFPSGTTVEVRPDGTVVITYPDKSVDTITGDKLVEKGSKQETPKVQTDAEKNPAQVPGNFVPVENTHNLTQTEQDTVAAKVKEANPAATDVKVSKDGTATLTYGDGSVNTIPGTSLVVAKDTDNEASTQAAQNPAVVPATTEVGNAHSLTPEEQAAVTAKVQAANPAATDVKVSKDGTATLTYSDGSVNTIPGTSLVVQKEETSTQEQPTIAEKTKVIIPANPTKVAEATRLTDEEKEAVKKAVVDANGFGSDVKVEVAGDGTATIVFKDGSAITIPGNQLVAQDPKAKDSTKLTAEKSTVKAPAQRVDVKDITHLTDEEKEKVKVAILQANGSALDGATINVAGDGTATITFPDGSVVTILGKDTVQQSAKGESVTQEATPEYKPETTPGGDNGGNTGSSDANANAGGGSQAGGQAHTGSQNPAQSQASKQLATEKESAKKAIEKAAKDKQDEIKGSPLSDKEKAELLARVEAEKQAALKEIENAKTVEDVKEAETIGVQAIAMVTVPKRPVAPNAAPQATSAPQATAGTMQDVTYQSPAGKQLPNTGSASSAALASLGLVAATSGFALLGRKARRRK